PEPPDLAPCGSIQEADRHRRPGDSRDSGLNGTGGCIISSALAPAEWVRSTSPTIRIWIAGGVATVPSLMIGTYRDVDLDVTRPFAGTLENLLRKKLAVRVTLRRLPLAGVEGMLAALSGQTTPPTLARIIFHEA